MPATGSKADAFPSGLDVSEARLGSKRRSDNNTEREVASTEPVSSNATLDDAQLVRAFVHGNTDAFRVLWRRHSELLHRFLRKGYGGDPGNEDVLQDAFLILAANAHRIRDPITLRNYLMTIAGRLALAERRRRDRTEDGNAWLQTSLEALTSKPVDFEGREAIRALGRLLERLPERRRRAFVLYYVDRLTIEQTALELGVSQATARRDVLRAQSSILRWCRTDPALRAYAELPLRR